MTAIISQCLTQLDTDLTAAFVATGGGSGIVNDVRDYRTWPGKLSKTISLSYQGGLPQNATTGGASSYYDIMAVIGVKMDTDESGTITEAELRTADQALNTIENGMIALLGKGGTSYKNSYWNLITFYRQSSRPPQFAKMPDTRIGLMYIRLHLK